METDLATLLGAFADHKLTDSRARLVRHGHLPERDILTGVGPVAMKDPRVRERKLLSAGQFMVLRVGDAALLVQARDYAGCTR